MGLNEASIPGLAVRQIAAAMLLAIIDGGHSLDDAAAAAPDLTALDPRDRNFVRALVLTALRRRGEADAVIATFLDKPLPRRAGLAPTILVLAATQLLFMDQPPHAVIDLAVHQAKADANAMHFAGLVNAVLRKVATRGKDVLSGLDGPRLDTPDWLWNRWYKAYGGDQAHAIASQHLIEPPLDLTVKHSPALWAERLGATLLPTGSIRLSAAHDALETLPGFAEGAWWVQDAASALPAKLLGDVGGRTVLDLCAAPGGKTLQLAAAGAEVTALDLSSQRLARLGANLARTGLTAQLITADATSFTAEEPYDAVLLDAPCSATGTIRRHPDLPYIKTDAGIDSLVKLQRLMLDSAARLTSPGGTLIYCTCSLEKSEGESQVRAFLARHPQFALVPVIPGEAGIPPPMVADGRHLRVLPFMALGSVTGLDGFFAARLQRLT